MISNNLELNAKFNEAYETMNESTDSVFITGKAGVGKSTLLLYFSQHTKKNYAVLAPTGVAALNVSGQTIHRFFNFKMNVTPDQIARGKVKPKDASVYKNLDTIIIDEVSMVRADLLDCINLFLVRYGPKKNQLFGGVQMIFLGDLYQLPPIVKTEEREIFKSFYKSPYFFSSKSYLETKIKIIELEKVYRQKDNNFVNLLNKIRVNDVNYEDIESLNKRCIEDFKSNEDKFYINLTTTNNKADEINNTHLSSIKGELYESKAIIDGEFGRESYPTLPILEYKLESQIMMLKNDHKGRWVNGSLGIIKSKNKADDGSEFLSIWFPDKKKTFNVSPYEWKIYRYIFDEKKIISQLAGTFKQLPFRLAWAITIHKSQGKTFDDIIIDFGNRVFSTGQVYVALSRCTSLEGIVLKSPIKKHFITTDYRINEFINSQDNYID
ncbi:MAG: ATP-dependent DNA helicase PIF1 [Candidatus Midichloriaceae bacterium]|jgi:ATP-dependent DNA helicase PIF1